MTKHIAPPFQLTSVVTKRQYGLEQADGIPLILLFVGYQTAKVPEKIVKTIRAKYPSLEDVQIFNVIDMRQVPRLLRGMAQGIMESAYQSAKKQIPDGYDPADYLILLPDWKGTVFKAYNIQDVNQTVAMVMISADGLIQQTYQGKDPTRACLDFLESSQFN